MANWKTILVAVLFFSLETNCFSLQRYEDRRTILDSLEDKHSDETQDSKENSKEQRYDYTRYESGTEIQIPTNLQHDLNKSFSKNSDNYNSGTATQGRLNDNSEERVRVLHSLKISKRSTFNDSSEEDDSSEERSGIPHSLNITKHRISNDSSEEDHSSEERVRNLHSLKISKRSVFNDSSEEDHSSEERFLSSSEEFVGNSPSLQISKDHTHRRDVNGLTHGSINNLREVSNDYLEELLYRANSKEDKTIVESDITEDTQEIDSDETDEDDELLDDDDLDESTLNDDAYEKYIDEIAKKYGYKSNEDNNDEVNEDGTDVDETEVVEKHEERDERDGDDDDYSRPCAGGFVRDSSGKCIRNKFISK